MSPSDYSPVPRVSVLMPAFHHGAYIARAIESVLTQTLRNLELILIDDGSTDGSASTIKTAALRDPRVRAEFRPHGGISAALNHGLSLARGEYVARLDCDDIAFPDRMERQVQYLDANTGVGLIGGRLRLIDTRERKFQSIDFDLEPSALRANLDRGATNIVTGSASMVRRQLALNLGGWRTPFDFVEDYDLALRVAERADVANIAGWVTYYRSHPQQTSVVHQKRQTALALAARFSAECRKRGDPDPVKPDSRLESSTVHKLGRDSAETDHLRRAFEAAEQANSTSQYQPSSRPS